MFEAGAVGASADGLAAAAHDGCCTRMTPLFVDTAGWMACADASDPSHLSSRKARDAAMRAGQGLLTTDYVVDVTLTRRRLRLGLAAAEAWWRQVDASPRVRWEPIDGSRFERATRLFFQYRDNQFSFTDCTSFAVVRELRITQALTTGRHFRQMGFQLVPGSSPRLRRR